MVYPLFFDVGQVALEPQVPQDLLVAQVPQVSLDLMDLRAEWEVEVSLDRVSWVSAPLLSLLHPLDVL